ncbi:hypothetical protein [Endozoicomonas atrinae]|uniref:hypothetical protein n=1 Tax=Endozoicomonas atrinae TaxID=1333660 RepID=UPI0008248665|nr:hypothetical protein [Endozoicomonas atrinae]
MATDNRVRFETVFVVDFTDGKGQHRKTVNISRSMVERKSALAMQRLASLPPLIEENETLARTPMAARRGLSG